MSKHLLLKTCVFLAVSTHAASQYVDFFENLNSFLQPFTTTNPRNGVTKRPDAKHRQTNKQKYQDAIFFEDDTMKVKDNPRNLDPFNFYSTTTKPRRKSTKTSTTSHQNNNVYTTHRPDNRPKKINSNKILNNNINVNRELIRSISSNNNEPYNSNNVDNKVINNARRIDNYNGYNDNQNGYNNHNFNSETTSNRATDNYGYQENYDNTNNNNNRQTTQRTTTVDYYNNARQTTRKTTTDYYNNARQTTPKTIAYYNNVRQTTHNERQPTNNYNNVRTTRRPSNNGGIYGSHTAGHNPLLHRPGVKPAAVDENRPPITNRPVTSTSVYDRPFDAGSYRPVNTRPPYETERPRPANRPETRPVNTRPPFETERPFSSGVVRPATSGAVRPATSGAVRPATSGAVRPATSGAVRPATSGTTALNEDVEPDIELGPDEDEMSDSEKRRLYDICEQKCDEYKAARVKKVVALPLAPNYQGVSVNVSSCAPSNVPLIIGGEVARIQQFPHMALVGWRKIQARGHSWKCGGSLVGARHVLTAGHCTYHDKDYNVVSGPPHAVQLGSAVYNDRAATVVRISSVVRHPKYKLRRSYYDVALIKMVTSVTFSDTISPACLGVPPPVGDPVIATGWGKTEFGGDSSIELRKVSIPIWDMSECRDIWGTSLKLPNGPMPDNQICAGERKGAKDTCQGDSGGPAQVQDGCAWRLVAVTSVGRSCGAPATPALYARIPRAFVASQIYTNEKPGRDGGSQYGNDGINVNSNRGNQNSNWGSENNNRGTQNSNSGFGNNNSGTGINNSDPFGNRNVANVRPIQNNNGQNYDNSGRDQNNSNGQHYSDNQGSGSGVANNNNGNNFDNNPQTTRDNNWSVFTDTTNDNRNNYQNNNNPYDNNQNNRNVYDQGSFDNNGQIYKTTTTVGYKQNNYGQNGYNNEQIQSGRNTETTSDVRSYETPSYGYNNGRTDNTYNDNRRTGTTYNDNVRTENTYNDNTRTGNTYNDGFNMNYPVANRPWWNN